MQLVSSLVLEQRIASVDFAIAVDEDVMSTQLL